MWGDNETSSLREENQAQRRGLRFVARELGPRNKVNMDSNAEFVEILEYKSKKVITHSCPPIDRPVK